MNSEEKIGISGQIRLESYSLPKFKRLITSWLGNLGFNLLAAFLIRKWGVLNWDTGYVKNGITNAGFAQLALLAGDASATPFTYLALGTSTTAFSAAQTALVAEIVDTGLERAAATVSRVTTAQTNDTLQLVKTFTSTGTKTVEEIGMFNAASTGTMLCRALTTSKALTDTDQLVATYKVKFAAS